MVLTCSSFQFREKKWLLTFQFLGSGFFTASYFFLGAGFGMVLNFTFLLRNILYFFFDPGKSKRGANISCIMLCLLYTACFAVYHIIITEPLKQVLLDLLPYLAAIPGTIALTETKPVNVRLWKYPDSVFWLAYNISCLSVGGILCEIFNLISNTVSIIRFRESRNS